MGNEEQKADDVLRFDRARVTTLLEDVVLLAEYGLEKGEELPEPIDIPFIFRLQDYKEHLEKDEPQDLPEKALTKLADYYEILTLKFAPVTADTLRATKNIRKGFVSTAGGKHLLWLWSSTASLVVFILFINYSRVFLDFFQADPGEEVGFAPHSMAFLGTYLIPFTYGALGSCAYLLRITEKHLRARTYDPTRTPEHWNRFALGTLSGGIIVLFIRQIPGVEGGTIELAPAALGFLAGYSIDFLFATLDRVINAILPKVGVETVARRLDREKANMLIAKYEKRAKDPNLSEEEREAAERFAKELKA